ncbi:MAG: BCCT family transporter [Kordiimonadaceae bacterium]|nr:BCCT family transporter [Kordiimonadaceae bacterium]MBT6330708.1 BCCT family transporter [Kordiimonadaceae bacterium]MBT7581794.1 BCCT family transporter [Kordiimonadaceae bacterium]
MAWLAFGRYGKVKLGDGEPVFSTLSWVAMLFSAGVGGSLLYWSVIEWAAYYTAPPFGAEPKSTNALEWATSYGMFHWGITAWCIYALPTIAISYSFYVRKIPYLRLSAAILGEKSNTSIWAKVIDFSFMIALIGGAGTSLSLTAPVISAGFSHLTGVERTPTVDLMVICLCIAIFGTSVYMGLEKGIKKLADANFYLSIILLLFVLIVGPTTFILMMGTESIGFMLANTIEMLTWTDAVDNTGFVQDYTIFYWAWWLAYAPYTGIFVTRISKGRTIKQVILSMCAYGSLGCWAFYIVLGNFALDLELSNALPLASMIEADAFDAISVIFLQLPYGSFALGLFIIVTLIYVATTYDSASYTLASAATKELHAGENPATWHRIFWAFALGILPIILMYIGGLKVVQSAVLLAGFPIAIASIFMVRTLLKSLREDHS